MALHYLIGLVLLLSACGSADEGDARPSDGGAGKPTSSPDQDGARDAPRDPPPAGGMAANSPLDGGSADGAQAQSARDAAGASSSPTGARDAAAVDLSAEIYAPENLPRFDIELAEQAIASLNLVTGADDPRQNDYVSASFKYGDETIARVGLRFKGEGSFQKLDRKPAFKLKFDEYVDDRAFRGLRRLTLNNAFEDPSFVAERLAYELFRAAGLPAPRCNNALVYVNGTFYGVYVNVEAEDKTFLRRWYESDDGNLYEEGQKDFVPGAETAFNLETNESANDRSDLKSLIAALQGATDPGSFLADISAELDSAQFLKFTAAEAAVNQWDMYSYTLFYVNNLRIYRDPTSAKFSFIPWGMDMSMKPFRDSRKPHIKLFTLARQGDRANGPVTAGLIFQRCLQSPACKSAYSAAVREIITAYEQLDLEGRANKYFAQIKAHVLEDKRKNVCCSGGTLSSQQFEAGFQSVITTIRGRVPALRADLDAM